MKPHLVIVAYRVVNTGAVMNARLSYFTDSREDAKSKALADFHKQHIAGTVEVLATSVSLGCVVIPFGTPATGKIGRA